MVGWIALAGAFGAVARYCVHTLVQSRVTGLFPFGTVVVNLSGSFVLGVVTGLAIAHGLDPDVRAVVGTGFIGAYTTFSSFSYETVGLLEDAAPRAALVNAFGSVAIGLVAATTGLLVAGGL
jgi:fluoride exporter